MVIDPCNPIEVPEGILGHAEVPAEDAREQRFGVGTESHDAAKFGEHRLHQFFI